VQQPHSILHLNLFRSGVLGIEYEDLDDVSGLKDSGFEIERFKA
jgi:hypothetical protein